MTDGLSGDRSATASTTLLARVRAQRPEAWERLVSLYGPVVYEWARRAGWEPNAAADVVQETFRSVLTSVAGFRRERPTDTFRGWLWTVARNKMRDRARRERRHGGASGGSSAYARLLETADPADDAEPSDAGTFNVARRALELVRGEFEPRTWQAFWQVTIDGRRPDLVAESLGLNVAAVYTYKSRVLRRLREELDGEI